jgi:hypothetical protein
MQHEPTQIAIGTSRYNVGIESTREWTSPDGSITRQYLTIGKPGISEVVNAYLTATAAPRSSEVVVETDHGTVVWQPAAGGMTSKKRDSVNAWFVAVLKK